MNSLIRKNDFSIQRNEFSNLKYHFYGYSAEEMKTPRKGDTHMVDLLEMVRALQIDRKKNVFQKVDFVNEENYSMFNHTQGSIQVFLN